MGKVHEDDDIVKVDSILWGLALRIFDGKTFIYVPPGIDARKVSLGW